MCSTACWMRSRSAISHDYSTGTCNMGNLHEGSVKESEGGVSVLYKGESPIGNRTQQRRRSMDH